MEEERQLYLQLHKLSAIKSEQELEQVLTLLWRTRKTGLKDTERASLCSLLSLPSNNDLDPVLVCLRSLIRKVVHESFASPDILKLFPPDLSMELQRMLMVLFEKYHNQWKEERSSDQHMPGRTGTSDPMNTGFTRLSTFYGSEISGSRWPRQDYSASQYGSNVLEACTPFITERNLLQLQQPLLSDADADADDNLGILPHLKSMTWTLENQHTTQTNRAAIINLKLQDYSRPSLGEIEVKFCLTRETLDAVIRSLTYISEQLSSSNKSSSEPLHKKQRQ